MSAGDDDVLKVLLHQKGHAETLDRSHASQARAADKAIASTEALIAEFAAVLPERHSTTGSSPSVAPPALRPWRQILNEADAEGPEHVAIADLLTTKEIRLVIERHHALEVEFGALHELDAFDWMISGAAGVLGALVDVFLVKVPRHPGFLGGPAAEGGWLSNAVKDRIGRLIPEEKIQLLEKEYPVSYDASTSAGLITPVPGLGPNTHRFQSLGHDPLLGWLWGVRDLLRGEFTAIGSDGRLIVQATSDPIKAGEHLLIRIFEALHVVGGHMLSDVATARGLPVPLMPLLMMLQCGSIGKQQYTMGEVARQMYRMGYDFSHFLASSFPVAIIEGVVRIAFFARAISRGHSLEEAVPIASNPKLRTQLLMAHTVATAANAGKIYVTQNPLAINWPQWLALFRYLMPQLQWLLVGREGERARYVAAKVENNWATLDEENALLWKCVFGDDDPVIL